MNYWVLEKDNVVELGTGSNPEDAKIFNNVEDFLKYVEEIEKLDLENVPEEELENFQIEPVFHIEVDDDTVEENILSVVQSLDSHKNSDNLKEYKAVLIDGFIKTKDVKNLGNITSVKDALEKIKNLKG